MLKIFNNFKCNIVLVVPGSVSKEPQPPPSCISESVSVCLESSAAAVLPVGPAGPASPGPPAPAAAAGGARAAG